MSTSVALIPEGICVRVATLARDQVPSVFYNLVRILFFTERADRFLSVTVTEADVTLVAEAEDLAHFEGTGLQVDETDWRVVRVGEGALGFEKVGVIERITGPLAAASIPVLYISTYSSDYVLIPNVRLDEALRQFDDAAIDDPEHTEEAPRPQHSHPLNVLHASGQTGCTRILQVERRHRHAHTSALIRLLFLPAADDAPQPIASLTETPDEISILAGDSDWLDEHCRTADGIADDPQLWVPLRVGDVGGTPLEEIGVVATQANVLSRASVTLLYLSTYFSDYTLILAEAVETAVAAFEAHGFTVTRHRAGQVIVTAGTDQTASGQPPHAPAVADEVAAS